MATANGSRLRYEWIERHRTACIAWDTMGPFKHNATMDDLFEAGKLRYQTRQEAGSVLGKIEWLIDDMKTCSDDLAYKSYGTAWIPLLEALANQIRQEKELSRRLPSWSNRRGRGSVSLRLKSAAPPRRCLSASLPSSFCPDDKITVPPGLTDEDRRLWEKLAVALYGEDDPRVKALEPKPKFKAGDIVILKEPSGIAGVFVGRFDLVAARVMWFVDPNWKTECSRVEYERLRLATPEEIAKAHGEV